MEDLISREEAVKAVQQHAKFLWERYHETCNLAGLLDAIYSVPTYNNNEEERKKSDDSRNI